MRLRGIGKLIAALGLFALLSACGGEVQIQKPAANAASAEPSTPAAFTATGRWTLVSATADGADVKNRFSLQSGDAQAVSEAALPLSPGGHTLTITANVGPMSQFFGQTQSTQTVSFTTLVRSLDLIVPEGLVVSPVTVFVQAPFAWRQLSMSRVSSSGRNDLTGQLSPLFGTAGVRVPQTLTLPAGDHRLCAGATEAADASQHMDSEVVSVVRGSPPLCDVPPSCNVGTNVTVGTQVGPQCGGGTWQYTDSTRNRCAARGGLYSNLVHAPPTKDTVCDPNDGSRKLSVAGAFLCVTAGGRMTTPPACVASGPSAGGGACASTCTDPALRCPADKPYKRSSIGGGCYCDTCPSG